LLICVYFISTLQRDVEFGLENLHYALPNGPRMSRAPLRADPPPTAQTLNGNAE
jgi:hypothetical protein